MQFHSICLQLIFNVLILLASKGLINKDYKLGGFS